MIEHDQNDLIVVDVADDDGRFDLDDLDHFDVDDLVEGGGDGMDQHHAIARFDRFVNTHETT